MAYTTIDNPELYFQCKLYSGNNSTNAITFDGDEDMSPNMVWLKGRSGADNHRLYDTLRSTSSLVPNDNRVEQADGNFSSFNSDGFTITGTDTGWNGSGETYVAWCWKEVSGIFDIITYSGTGSNMDVSHNLSAVPAFFAIKNRDVDQAWRVYHKNMTIADPYSTRMVFSETGSQSTSALGLDADPTSSVINIGTGTGCTNASGEDFVCYAWKEIKAFSKYSSYVGNGSTNGPYINLGFRPSFFLYKSIDTGSEEWKILDNKRDPFNRGSQRNIHVNSSSAESDDTNSIGEFLSNGVKIRSSHNNINKSGDNYIFMAFAEQPFVNSKGVPANAR